MNRSDSDKLTDILLGEAVLSVIKQQKNLNAATLLERLQGMAASEQDSARYIACLNAITVIKKTETSSATQRLMRNLPAAEDNVIRFDTDNRKPSGSNKH
ncbi:hypothetical protein [Erwinia oleae]|uniref:hypothetical protein n=1 Tax=Erwinia oleae TaxID=796334 RepID=UPI0005505827|nr:hypothetical protein [Erwinia oleae]